MRHLIWLFLWALLTGPNSVHGDVATAALPNTVIVGYFPEWGVYKRNYHVTHIPGQLLTHVNYAFLKPVFNEATRSAAIEIVDRYAALEKVYAGDADVQGSFGQLARLKARHPGLEILLSVGGASMSDSFSDIAAYPEARESFAESCVSHLVRYGFDGIDIDWEFPVEGGERSVKHRPEDGSNLVMLLETLRRHLQTQAKADGKSYRLTLATSISGRTLEKRYRLREISQAVDWMNLMAYNLTGPWAAVTGHQAPLHPNPQSPAPSESIEACVARYLELGVPPAKLVLGMPFYGRAFKGVAPENNGLFQPHAGSSSEGSWSPGVFTYRDLLQGSQTHPHIDAPDVQAHWDSSAQASFLYKAESETFITYPSPRSTRSKAAFVRHLHLRGMMCWSLDMDSADDALLTVIHTELNKPR